MRKVSTLKRALFLMLALLLPLTVGAVEVEINGLWYDVDTSGSTAEVIENKNGQKYSGNITIPNSVTYLGKSYSVTSIDGAFYGCSGLTSVEIPNNVTSIRDLSFYACNGLISIIIENGNSKYDSRDNCNAIIETSSSTLIHGCKTTVIPTSVTSIGDNAFGACFGLTSITIPNSVTYIGNGAFMYCRNLASIEIPNSVTSIDGHAFYDCSGLTSVTIPNSVTSIGIQAFDNCSSLTTVTINNYTPISIGSRTFSNQANATLYVPYGSKTAYEAADYWKEFKTIISLPENVTVTVGPKGWATYIAEYDLDFLAVEGLKAYTATTDGMTVTLTQVDKVQKDTGLVLKGKGTHVVPLAAGSTTAKGDLISGVVDTDADTEYNYYGLTVNSLGMAYFARITGTIAAGKAYLRVAKGSSARDVLDFDDEVTTGIQGVDSRKENGSVYSLQGVRVLQPRKGLYIVNGKKVNVK